MEAEAIAWWVEGAETVVVMVVVAAAAAALRVSLCSYSECDIPAWSGSETYTTDSEAGLGFSPGGWANTAASQPCLRQKRNAVVQSLLTTCLSLALCCHS